MSADNAPVLLLRLEGPLQAWGHQSRLRVRETAREPTLSGVVGLIACCMGLRRNTPLGELAEPGLQMAVRIDRPGTLLRDYHTVGAGYGIMAANRKVKHTAETDEPETLPTERFYLSDASFLVVLSGEVPLLDRIERALHRPVWPPFLGRKSCPPAEPIFAGRVASPSLLDALSTALWRPRLNKTDLPPDDVRCVVECRPDEPGAVQRFDRPVSFGSPQRFTFRYVRDVALSPPIGDPVQEPYKPPRPKRMNYRTAAWKQKRCERGERDRFLCVFCGVPSIITHHITYERVRQEDVDADLRSVCRLCHDAITMLEAERDMGLHRIDPLSEEFRRRILDKRAEIEATRHVKRHKRRHRKGRK